MCEIGFSVFIQKCETQNTEISLTITSNFIHYIFSPHEKIIQCIFIYFQVSQSLSRQYVWIIYHTCYQKAITANMMICNMYIMFLCLLMGLFIISGVVRFYQY